VLVCKEGTTHLAPLFLGDATVLGRLGRYASRRYQPERKLRLKPSEAKLSSFKVAVTPAFSALRATRCIMPMYS
jgi:hypothetical protein